ncbi:hypothetical protein ABD388_14160 [Bacteroides thetaiotaomicron]|uniref:hypothetical protein n=1 Tax=Bacteroides TaxID=816 RepID=UPI00234CA729|nr:hypothetical protein [Bacteroides faecis]MDC7156225.1 hypothetical protein [Bacteroides faecis]
MERSETLLLLSVAMGWSFHLLAKPFSRALLGVADTEQTGWHILPKRSSLPASHEIR